MTLERTREIIAQQLQFGGGYNRNAVRLLPGEIAREHVADGPRFEAWVRARANPTITL